jgi:hypothetical protein
MTAVPKPTNTGNASRITTSTSAPAMVLLCALGRLCRLC